MLYLVVKLNDLRNEYKGIGDIETYLYKTLDEAKNKMSELSQNAIKYFDNQCDYDISKDFKKFSVTDGESYIHAEIRMQNLKNFIQ